MATTKAAPRQNSALTKALLEAGIEPDQKVYVIKSPIAGTEYADKVRVGKTIYGVVFTEGVGVTTDEDTARQIVREFPDYVLAEA